MNPPMAPIQLEKPEPGVVVIRGEIDMEATEPLIRFAEANMQPSGIVLDLAGVTFIDSVGISGLLQIRAAVNGGLLTLRNPSRRVSDVLEIVRAGDWPNVSIERT
jgi:anti-anti-sigma factor